MLRLLVAILALLALIAQSLAVQPHEHSKLPATTTVGIVSRPPLTFPWNGPPFLLQLRGR